MDQYAVCNFEKLSDSVNLRIATVQAILGCSRSTVWGLIKNGKIQKQTLNPRIATITVGELRKYIATQCR